MKPIEKQPKKAHGAYVATAVRSLKKSGLTGSDLQTAIDAIRGFKEFDLVKLPRKVAKVICEQLSKHKRIVVINKTPKRFKVFSLEGYLASQSSSSKLAHATKPWEYARKAKEAKKLLSKVADSKSPQAVG